MSFTRDFAVACLFVITSLFGTVAIAEGPQVRLVTTMGDIVLELDVNRAPLSVENFLQYVDDDFYKNTLFHRVIEGFMIQGGGFSTEYQRKVTRKPVSNEAFNGLSNRRYTIAMARTTAPHSATSQFFINSENNDNLDHTGTTQRGWGYTVFGRVIEGEEVVDRISQVATGAGGPFGRDVPAKPVVILSAERIAEPVAQALQGSVEASSAAPGQTGDAGSATLAPAQSAGSGLQPVEQN